MLRATYATVLAVAILTGLAASARADSLTNSFKNRSTLAWSAPIDPIMAPGGVSHEHRGWSAKNVTSTSTGFTLQADIDQTSSENRFFLGGYWNPAFYMFDGVEVVPETATIYYQRVVGLRKADGTPINTVEVPPIDMRIVAGNAHATIPQKPSVAYWSCGVGPASAYPPGCGDSTTPDKGLAMRIIFPSCWDGQPRQPVELVDHVKPFTVVNGVKKCPAGYDKQIPRVLFNVHYHEETPRDCRAPGTSVCVNYSLSSGSPVTLHADWMQGHRDDDPAGQAGFDDVIRDCLNVPDGTEACNIVRTDPPGTWFDPTKVI
jgi:hypothetical protein